MSAATRKKIVAGNWKMNKTVAEALALVDELRGELSEASRKVDVVLAPPFVAIVPLAKVLDQTLVRLAGQNCHWETSGAFTGEVSAAMLKSAGCAFVIVGHSERRQYFGETDETVNKRAKATLATGLSPIVCIGETLQERDAGTTLTVVTRQLEGGLKGIPATDMARVVMAYEPVWAIGTGRNATPAQAQEVHAHIRQELTRLYGREVAQALRIQYGGSVKAENAGDLMGQPDIDGALVGGASLKAADFSAIVHAAE